MAKMLINLGYKWGDGALDNTDGYVFNAGGVHSEQARRRDFRYYPDQWLLFDPQLYLTALDGEACQQTCARLATYSWFGINVPDYNSGEMTQKAWLDSVKSTLEWAPTLPSDPSAIRDVVNNCFRFQEEFGVTHLIAPTPLVDNGDDQFGVQLAWLEAAASLRHHYEQPMLASIAISDYLLSSYAPARNPLLQTILDHLTVSDFEGLYVVPVQEAAETVRLLDNRVVESLLYISYVAGRRASKEVIVNFADDLGYACLAAGATAYGTGGSFKQRRMCKTDFIDRDGGSTYPHFYSHRLIGDFLTQDDLTKFRDARLLRLLEPDVTDEAVPLLQALKHKKDANSVPAWRQGKANVTAALRHRMTLLHKATVQLLETPEADRLEVTLAWVQDAEAQSRLIGAKLNDSPLREDLRHLPVWSSALEKLLDYIDSEEYF